MRKELRQTQNSLKDDEPSSERLPPEQKKLDWQSLYQEHAEPIYRYIYSKVGNREEAEDLTAQTFVKAVRSIDYTRSPHSIQKWLFQTARTTLADYWRTYYRLSIESLDVLLNSGWEGPATEDDISEASSELLNAEKNPTEYVQSLLALLPQHYREVLNCRFLYNLSIRETATLMGLTEANVKVLQFRALKHAATLEKSLVLHTKLEGGE